MSKRKITNLLYQCLVLENDASTPAKRKFWSAQYRKLRALAVATGWID